MNMITAKQNQKFPFHFFFRLCAHRGLGQGQYDLLVPFVSLTFKIAEKYHAEALAPRLPTLIFRNVILGDVF